ncbi:uncharacterized protein CANTADRAFT_27159 [Suhomyces tanzawaensis NRRL Y-17324]|uniref:Diphthine--ammonia ligase n=1 Tax=Suhomyces tanzawaensis NRRL Y-17324 TaxID=984487 RepID=A0A1E4SCS7_9ASCO|nr:uncharacterized protein CANTADRAFT_27159 [Suhomyces tanzawaensis NRRL Y-17324]ODV77268.1 hypothetical protein CANTADRAFT_27159 [Suhomyces tanzawaensis NRRL Y-17324]
MKFVALISGGKDSFFNIHRCLSQGHELVALANLYPQTNDDEIDSFMFQTVGHDIIEHYSQCLETPLYRQAITGGSTNQSLEYSITENDEIEDLHQLLSTVLEKHPDIQGVSCGAILSHYQRTRVENVCDRLGLTSLTYLWQLNQYELMQEMCNSRLDARIIKVAAIGLNSSHLGKSISQLFPHLVKLNSMYEVHICGEGGEFETIVLDAPFFKKKLHIVDQEIVNHSNDDVSYLKIKVEQQHKEPESLELPSPVLLEENFEEMLDDLTSEPKLDALSLLDPGEISAVSPSIVSTATKLYVSNLTSDRSALEEQAKDIFEQLQKHLILNELGFNDIQHITLLLANMGDFAHINEIYSKQFQGLYLPPSRVCVQTELAREVQLSCIVLKNQTASEKLGLHVRSRSFWAPQNIGPYSQCIVEKQTEYHLVSLSGQIPLIPASMEISASHTGFNSVLSLQHLHRVKALIGTEKLALVICFIKESSTVSIARDTWKNYPDSIGKLLVIAEVSELPRAADIEWSGTSYKDIVGMYDDSDDESETDETELDRLINSFEDRGVVQIGKVKLQFVTLFTNSSDKVKEVIKFNKNIHHIQLITKSLLYKELETEYPGSVEFLPVKHIYNSEGVQYNYGLIWRVET